MEREETRQLLKSMGIERHQIFISLSSKDKDLALPLIQMLETRKMNYWCMFYATGEQRNIAGDNYEETIARHIKSCCVFVFLFSKFSVKSLEVKKELSQVAEAISRQERIKVIPISLDETTVKDLPEDIVKMGLFDQSLIYRQMGDGSKEANELVVSEIRTQYYDTLLENISIGYRALSQSYLFTDLLRDCIHRKCVARTVSQDIKASDEGSKESLMEAHIITDEIAEYDCHPYSCMLISSNLLGNFDVVNKEFNPEKYGVKYFYYCPEAYLTEIEKEFRQKIKNYLEKNRLSRGEVVLMVRRDFDERNSVLHFINLLNKLTVEDLLNKYNITDPEEIKVFTKEMEKDENNIYFGYTETEDERLQIPEEFYGWMSDDRAQLYDESIRAEAYEFIKFLNRLIGILKGLQSESPARDRLVQNLKKHCRYLDQLVTFERWQMQDEYEDKISNVTAKKLCNHLIGFNEGAETASKEFPNLSKWLRFTYDPDGKIEKISDEMVDKALSNLIFIPIKEDSIIKPCYSFVVYINKNSTHASWYSTGYIDETRNMVIAYDANPEAGECKAYMDAFKGLIKYDKSIRDILVEHDSKIIEKKRRV